MIQVADNFNYRGKKPNFDRDSFDTLQDMKNYSENSLDDGHISYCKETGKHYKFNSNNQSDLTTGKWIEQHEAVPADEEDITEQNGTLQLANKTYDKQSFSGLGRVYLRKNIVGDKNVLTQAMINKANTIYVIQYDYDLKEASINIPENCVLQFDGGSLSNGTIVGNKTSILSSMYQIFTNVSVDGTYNVDTAYSEWFGSKGDGITDDREAIQSAIGLLPNTLILGNKTYMVSYTEGATAYYTANFKLPSSITIIGNNTKLLRTEGSNRCFEGSCKRENIIFLTENVQFGSTTVTVTDTSKYKVGDKILIVGEDGTSFNVLDFSKLLIATMLDTESNISSVKLHNVTLYNNKFKSFDTFFSTIGNRVYLTGQITIQIPEDNSYGKFNSFNIGEEFIIPITIHYNKTSTATSDILYNFNNLLLTKADWYSEEDDIEIKGNLIGSKSQSIVIGKSKTGWNSKKLNVTIFDNTNCYISFVPKTTDTHAEIKLFIYARPFLNKSNTSTGNATVKTINIRSYGDTQHRPIIDRCNIGTMYFDTTLGKPIFNKNNSQWVDATGATV